MAEEKGRLAAAYLRPRALYWRSVGALLFLQAIGWGCAAGLAYLMLSPELAKDYFSAHRTVKATWKLVVPALATAALAGFFVVGLISALNLRRHTSRVLEPLGKIDGLLRGLAAGRLPRPDAAAKGSAVESAAAAMLEPLHARVQEFRRISRDLQKIALELNYRSAGTEAVTLKDLRGLAQRLDAVSKELAGASNWFEG